MEAARNEDIVLAYETFGPPGGEPLLLISGTGAQMLIWPEGLCAALADRGFQVARFDNRDTGLSTHLTGAPAPGWLTAVLRPSAAPYRLADMADDALSGRAEGVNVIQIAPVPDVVDVSRLGFRKDGTSVYRPPGEPRYVTAEHLDLEEWLLSTARPPPSSGLSPWS